MNFSLDDQPGHFATRRVAKPGGDAPIRDQELKQELRVSRRWPADQWDSVRRGLSPCEMEIKWYMFSDGWWVHYFRSWTGHAIFSARFEVVAESLHMVEAWVSRDPHCYRWSEGAEEEEIACLYRLPDWIGGEIGS